MYVGYVRVSTKKQGISGLGLDAQMESINNFIGGAELNKVFQEIETGTSKKDRPVLSDAISYAKRKNATLVIAKLDRLSRSVAFISNLIEKGIKFVALDYPDASPLMLQFAAIIAEQETRLISQRTKAALQQAKKRGVQLGNPNIKSIYKSGNEAQRASSKAFHQNVYPIINDIKAAGITTLRGIATALNSRGIKTARGGEWYPMTVSNVIKSCT